MVKTFRGYRFLHKTPNYFQPKAASNISNGMKYFHDKFLVHCDLKSYNMLVGEQSDQEWVFKVNSIAGNVKSKCIL